MRSLPLYLCPSDRPLNPTFTVVGDGGTPITTVAFANYAGLGGIYEVTGFPDTNTGVLLRNSRYRVTDITDGSSNTLMVVEAAAGVPWTAPQDLIYEAGKPPPKVNGHFKTGFNAVFADGSVKYLPVNAPDAIRRGQIVRHPVGPPPKRPAPPGKASET